MFKTELPEDKPMWQVGCDKCAALSQRVARLEEALKPFADEYEKTDPAHIIPPNTIVKWTELPIDVFRNAAQLLAEGHQNPDGEKLGGK